MSKIYFIILNISLIVTYSFAQPTIDSFIPISGPVGTNVTIYGTNFNAVAANNIVYFGATKANVISAGVDSILVAVPLGVSYKFISVTNSSTNLTGYSKKPFVLTFDCGGSFTSSSFTFPSNFSTALGPNSLLFGDFDLDGKADIVCAKQDNNAFCVLQNTSISGAVSFNSFQDYDSYTNTKENVVCDFDGDGMLDVAAINFEGSPSGNIAIYKNTSATGTISFSALPNIYCGTFPNAMTTADYDGDGKSDLALTYNSGGLFIYRNTSTLGSISFALGLSAGIALPDGQHPSIATGDIDGNNKPDIVLINDYTYTLSIFQNTSTIGTIAFAPEINLQTCMYNRSVAIGDLDNDGKEDVITVSQYDSISIYRNTSSLGVISFDPKLNYTSEYDATDVALGDLNGDGKLELVVSSAYSSSGTSGNKVNVFSNTSSSGTIAFAAKTNYTMGSGPQSVGICDIDGDGKNDLIAASMESGAVLIKRNLCVPTNVPELNRALDINIYPNPFSEYTTIYFSEQKPNTVVSIYDVLGKKVTEIPFTGAECKIHKSNLNSGIYLLKILAGNELLASKKLIIN